MREICLRRNLISAVSETEVGTLNERRRKPKLLVQAPNHVKSKPNVASLGMHLGMQETNPALDH